VPTGALSKLQVAQGHPGSSRARAREREREREIARVARSGEIFFRVFRDFGDAFGGEFSRSLPHRLQLHAMMISARDQRDARSQYRRYSEKRQPARGVSSPRLLAGNLSGRDRARHRASRVFVIAARQRLIREPRRRVVPETIPGLVRIIFLVILLSRARDNVYGTPTMHDRTRVASGSRANRRDKNSASISQSPHEAIEPKANEKWQIERGATRVTRSFQRDGNDRRTLK